MAATAGLGAIVTGGGAAGEPTRQVVKQATSGAGKAQSDPSQAQTMRQRLAEIFSTSRAFDHRTKGWTYPKPGFSVRQGQRMAAKRRNQARNKAAHRRAS